MKYLISKAKYFRPKPKAEKDASNKTKSKNDTIESGDTDTGGFHAVGSTTSETDSRGHGPENIGIFERSFEKTNTIRKGRTWFFLAFCVVSEETTRKKK